MNRVMVVIGLALLAAGLVVGFGLGVHSNGYDCGAPFSTTAALDVAIAEVDDAIAGGVRGPSDCTDARASARVLPIVLLVVGAVSLVGSGFIARQQPSSDEPS